MPTVVFVSPKGGVGKTTSALVLATELAQLYDVTLVDADPNRPVQAWAEEASVPPRLSIISDVNEETILDRIEEAAARTPMVIVDLEGTAAKIVVLAVSQADLVIIPTQGSQLDAAQASRAIKVVMQSGKMRGKQIPFAVLLTRTNPQIRTRSTSHIQKGLIEAGIPVMETELNDREAFRGMFAFRQPLARLDPAQVSNLDKARANAQAFAAEVVNKLAAGASNKQTEVA